MGWYSSEYKYRAAISVNNDTGAGAGMDVNVTIPTEWDHFWDEIDASGNELRVTAADGVTLLTYDVDDGAGGAFSKANRAGRIQVDGMTGCGATAVECIWVYYGTDGAQGDGSSSVTIASAKTGTIFLGRPATHLSSYAPENPGSALPRQVIHKSSTETVYVWMRFDPGLAKRYEQQRGRNLYEEGHYVVAASLDSGGSAAALHSVASSRFRWYNGQLWVATSVTGGSSGSAYTVVGRLYTRVPNITGTWQTLESRLGVRVRDVLAT